MDLGSYPGSWSQVAFELVGSTGKVAAVDIKEMKLQNCFFLHKSIEEIHESDFKEISEFVPFVGSSFHWDSLRTPQTSFKGHGRHGY